MPAFIVLTRLSYQALNSRRSLADLSGAIMKRIRDACAGVEWKAAYVVLDCGAPADYVDIFTAPDIGMATKVATIVRAYGHATTEIWAATEWDKVNADIAALNVHFHEASRKEAVAALAEQRDFLEALPSRLQPLPENVRSAEHLLNHNLIDGVTAGSSSEL